MDQTKEQMNQEHPEESTRNENQEMLNDEVTSEESAQIELNEEGHLASQLDELNDKYIRLLAEFDNYKRRTAKERIDLIRTAGQDILSSLLPVLDDFDRAQKSISESKDMNAVIEGVNLVHQKLKGILAQQGLKEMEPSIGTAFDTDLHEAITNVNMGEEQKGKVVDEVEKGYFLNDKVLRFAKVIVGA